MSEYMNTKGLDAWAISLYFDDNAFSTTDTVCNDTVRCGRPGGKIYSPYIHDAHHSGADSVNMGAS